MALMELKLEGTNLVMQENVTNIRDRGRLAGAGVRVTGRLLWTLPLLLSCILLAMRFSLRIRRS